MYKDIGKDLKGICCIASPPSSEGLGAEFCVFLGEVRNAKTLLEREVKSVIVHWSCILMRILVVYLRPYCVYVDGAHADNVDFG